MSRCLATLVLPLLGLFAAGCWTVQVLPATTVRVTDDRGEAVPGVAVRWQGTAAGHDRGLTGELPRLADGSFGTPPRTDSVTLADWIPIVLGGLAPHNGGMYRQTLASIDIDPPSGYELDADASGFAATRPGEASVAKVCRYFADDSAMMVRPSDLRPPGRLSIFVRRPTDKAPRTYRLVLRRDEPPHGRPDAPATRPAERHDP